MPNQVPLPTKEEEDRRAWVTAHHEVVRLCKDCFGDRFSNNEIFDRLKISRRTGYRALGNDDRIGKAAGRKPKISDSVLRDIIAYIEGGGCRDVGNVWKHLALNFAPDCNPKTVQDAVKKSGFKNHLANDQVRLSPMLNEVLPDEPDDTLRQGEPGQDKSQQHDDDDDDDDDGGGGAPVHQQADYQVQHSTSVQLQSAHQSQANVIDPSLPNFPQLQNPIDIVRQTINDADEHTLRQYLQELVVRQPELIQQTYTSLTAVPSYDWQYGLHPATSSQPTASLGHHLFTAQTSQSPFADLVNESLSQRKKTATCRRCGEIFYRTENTMDNRQCAYHKGSPQKNSPETTGSIEEAPEAYIWSCCGGNGASKGCTRAMHTTKKKRTYGKKRDADEAGLNDEDDPAETPQGDDQRPPAGASAVPVQEDPAPEEPKQVDKQNPIEQETASSNRVNISGPEETTVHQPNDSEHLIHPDSLRRLAEA